MLDYVANLNQKRSGRQRLGVCLALSVVLHLTVMLILILFPDLLAAGYYNQFHGFRWGSQAEAEDELWRTIAMLEPPSRMNMPSMEVLRRSMGLADKDQGAGSPPVKVRFGPLEARETDKPPLPQIPPEIEKPEVTVPDDRKVAPLERPQVDTGDAGEAVRDATADLGTGNETVAAKPAAQPVVEVAENVTPTRIPEKIRPESPAASSGSPQPAAKTLPARNSGIELFDTQGFPLGDYQTIIVNKVKSKWFIPSNLKDSLGKTTVVFYIDKDGRCSGVRIVSSSGSNSLDLAALSAVTGSDPFPPLPPGYPGKQIGVKISMIPEP